MSVKLKPTLYAGILISCFVIGILLILLYLSQMNMHLISSKSSDNKLNSNSNGIQQNKPLSLSKSKHTIVIMSDTRNISTSNFLSISTTINYLYAQKYGYKFMFYKWDPINKQNSAHALKFKACCSHSVYGRKSAPWCKVICIYHALNNINYIVNKVIYIDTDAIFFNHNIDFNNYLQTAKYILYNIESSAIVPCNCPWHYEYQDTKGINTGISIFYKTNMSNCILTDWWNANYPICRNKFMKEFFEQTCFSNYIKVKYKKHISILNETSLVEYKGQYWRHIGSHAEIQRQQTFEQIFNQLKSSVYKSLKVNISNIIDRIKKDHTIYINDKHPIKIQMEQTECPMIV
eukprot:230764_1